MERVTIVNADDLGLCPSVNQAIFRGVRGRNLSSATLMVNMPGTKDALDRVGAYPALGVGLHFCLTEGTSLSGPSGLTGPDGSFRPRPELAKAAVKGRVRAPDVVRELVAQLAVLEEAGILRPMSTAISMHMLPAILEAMVPVLRERDLPMRIVAPPRAALSRPGAVRGRSPQALNAYLADRAFARAPTPTNQALVSIHDLDDPGPYDKATYSKLLSWVPPERVTEVMVHPHRLGPDLLEMYGGDPGKRPFLERCRHEYEALTAGPIFGELPSSPSGTFRAADPRFRVPFQDELMEPLHLDLPGELCDGLLVLDRTGWPRRPSSVWHSSQWSTNASGVVSVVPVLVRSTISTCSDKPEPTWAIGRPEAMYSNNFRGNTCFSPKPT